LEGKREKSKKILYYCPSKGRIRNEEKERKKFLGEEIAMKSASKHFIKFEKEKKPQQQIEQKVATSTISQKERNRDQFEGNKLKQATLQETFANAKRVHLSPTS